MIKLFLSNNLIHSNTEKKLSEVDAQNKLESFRKLNKNYLFQSFNTIAGTGKNAEIVHYRETKKKTNEWEINHLYFIDTYANKSCKQLIYLKKN